MAKPTDKERVGAWQKRINAANKTYEEWENQYECRRLEEFYYGKQWAQEAEDPDARKYVINLFHSSIQISQPSMLFALPKYTVSPRLTRIDDKFSDVELRAKLQEQTLNHFVTAPQVGFGLETDLATLDSYFRFGVVQVGYTADFIDNPTAGKPILNDKGENLVDGDNQTVAQPAKKLQSESLFYKWIPASSWRVSDNAPNRLDGTDWCGYFEWHRIDDVMANPQYKNTSGLRATGKLKNQTVESNASDEERQKAGMLKLWFIWDRRAGKRFVFPQGGEKFFLEKPFAFLPFATLKPNEQLGKWYPVPVSYNWLHPQRELNDTRETQRIHRKRANRRYRRSPAVEETEFDKLKTGDMVCIVTPNENDITPIPDAPLDPAVARNIAQTEDDFTRVSGISGEAQEVAQSETATQANLIALASKVREGKRRLQVAEFLSELGRVTLLTLRENMALPFWIQLHVDPYSPLAALEAQQVALSWKQIVNSDLGAIDNDVTVEISSLSPVAQEQERDSWLAFLNLMTAPVGAVIAQSPLLLRKTAGLFGIHNERDLSELAKAMQMMAMMSALMQAKAAGGGASKGGTAAPGPTPSNGAIQGQLAAQLPVELTQ